MRTKIQALIVLQVLLLSQFITAYEAAADNLSIVQPRVNQIQANDPSLPSGVSEQKGLFGTIIANVFDAAGRINSEFLTNLISGVSNNVLPKWNGTKLVATSISDNGSTTTIGQSTNITQSSWPALNVTGGVKVNGSNWLYLQNNRIYGDNATALYYDSNDSNTTQFIMRDTEGAMYGAVYGGGNGSVFGLLDGDGSWSYLAAKDSYTQFRINDNPIIQLETDNLYSSVQQQVIGWNRTGNRYAYTDYVGDDTYTDYGLRVLRGNAGANSWSELTHRGTGDFVMQAIDAGTLKFRTNTTDRMVIMPTTGNVGIGSTNPGAKLSIANGADDPVNYGKALQITNVSGNRQQIAFIRNGFDVISAGYNGASSVWGFGVGNATDASFTPTHLNINTSNGNVGIGAIASGDKLSVTGNIAATGDLKASRLCDAAGGNCAAIPISTGVSGTTNYVPKFSSATALGNSLMYDNGSAVGIGTTAPGALFNIVAANSGPWGFSLRNNTFSASENGAYRIYQDNAGITHQYNNNVDTLLLNTAGSVGVGMAPTYKLDVNGDIRANGDLRTTGTLRFNNQSFWGDTSSAMWYRSNHASVAQLLFQNSAGGDLGRIYSDGGGIGLMGPNGAWNMRAYNGGNELYGISYANDMRSSIFYDRDNTGFYVDPASVSILNDIRPSIIYDRDNTGYYVDPNGTSSTNIFYRTYGFNGPEYDGNDGGYYVDPNGVSRLNDIRPNIMYDGQDTSYYSDPNGTSRLNVLNPNVLTPYGVGGNSGVAAQAYGIYQEAGAWTSPFPDMVIAFHTGIKIGAHPAYGGTRFYNNYPGAGTEIFSVGNGDDNVRVQQSTLLCQANTAGCLTRFSDDGYVQDNNDGWLRFNGSYSFENSFRTAGDASIGGNAVLNGSNSWTFHTPDDGRTTLYFGNGTNGGVTSWPYLFNANGNLETNDVYLRSVGKWASTFSSSVSGTANYMAKFTGANTVGNSVVYDNGSSVGIGTAAPEAKLHVVGDILTNNSNVYYTKNNVGGNEAWMWPRWSDNIMYTNFGANGWNIRNNGSASVMFLQNGGNVGIGTTGPAAKLDVQGGNGSISDNGIENIRDGSNRGISIGYDTTNDRSWIYSRYVGIASKPLSINDSLFVGTLGGNVGIGTASPGYKLDVAGDTKTNWLRLNSGYGIYSEAFGSSLSPFNATYWYSRNNNGMVFQSPDGSATKGYVYFDGPGGGSFGLLHNAGGWAVRGYNGGVELYGDTYTAALRPTIIYDRDNAGYYMDPNGTSNTNVFYRTYGFNGPEYDGNDSTYYVDPNGTSMLNTTIAAYGEIRNTGTPQLALHKPGVFATYIGLNASNRVSFGGWSVGANTAALEYGIMYDGNDNGYYMDPNGVSRFNDIRPNIMYDGQDTSYYVDPNSWSRISSLAMIGTYNQNNGSPTMTFQDTDQRGASIHVNSNQFYILSAPAGANQAGWAINGSYWPLQIDMNNDQATFGGNVWIPEGSLKVSCVGNCF